MRRYTPCQLLTLLLLAVLTGLLLPGCSEPNTPAESANGISDKLPDTDPDSAQTYVGSEACATCHSSEWSTWQDSHHDLALQAASAESVLAPFSSEGSNSEANVEISAEFDGASFQEIHQQDDTTYQITPETGAEAQDVVYTFGVEPLQQYVIAAESGALQTYPIAWDNRPADTGGQRWFNLHAEVYPEGDPMHWSGRANRWNSQCADCHSTNVEKHYDAESRTYSTTFSVEDVGCEACHGPASGHVENPATYKLIRLASQAEQVNACAQCHSRRGQIAEGFRPDASFFDHYSPRLLTPGLYHVDGQIDEEVYVYGSFTQSRMHLAGVTCSNCHDPHSATLKRPGNETCTLCHQSAAENEFAALSAGNYDDPSHHMHPAGSEGARCVACHMPARTYMGIDDRRDHSLRIPRPDLAEALGVPEPCTTCHQDQNANWAAGVIRAHFGEKRPQHFAETFAAVDTAQPNADAALAELIADTNQPIMVRASALARLGAYRRGYTLDAIRLARSAEPLLRFAAPLAAASLSAENRWRLLSPLLKDELRAVRHQAVAALIPTLNPNLIPGEAQQPDYAARLAPHLDEWLIDLAFNLDFPETLTNMAGAQMAMGNTAAAEASLRKALQQQPSWVPGLLNLADIYRSSGRDAAAGPLLVQALELAPEQPEVVYGYALWLSRQDRLQDSLAYFERAAALAPEQASLSYAWAIALNDSGQGEQAVNVLTGLLARWPDDQQLTLALITILRDQGRFAETLPLLDRLLRQNPGDQQLHQFREAMSQAAVR